MTRSATDVMREVIFAAVVDSLDALKASSKGVPNTLLREIGAIHVNSTFSDLPPELQAAIQESVRAAFNRLLKEGYSVSQAGAAPPPRRTPPPQMVDRGGRRPGPPRGPRPTGGKPRPPRSR